MPPDLVVCPFCDRLYSHYSLKLHIPKCFDNPLRVVSAETKGSSVEKNNKRKSVTSDNKLKPIRRSRSANSILQNRPKTHTIINSSTDSLRICYVCGKHQTSDKLANHEKYCEKEWRRICDQLPSHIRTKSPKRMQIPSVDGTKNIDRLNKYARESADRAQKARCIRCSLRLLFEDALAHRCSRFEPSVEFYF